MLIVTAYLTGWHALTSLMSGVSLCGNFHHLLLMFLTGSGLQKPSVIFSVQKEGRHFYNQFLQILVPHLTVILVDEQEKSSSVCVLYWDYCFVLILCRVNEVQSRPKREYKPKPRQESVEYDEPSNGAYASSPISPLAHSPGKKKDS